MAEDPRFLLHFKTLAKFKEKLADGTVSEQRHLVFIKDAQLVWCRGKYYADGYKSDNFTSYYNNWEISKSTTNEVEIKLKGNEWNSNTRTWVTLSKALNIPVSDDTHAGIITGAEHKLLNTTLPNRCASIESDLSAEATARANADAAEVTNRNTAITNAINALDSDKTGSSTHVTVQVVETDGKISSVAVSESDIASAATLSSVKTKVDGIESGANKYTHPTYDANSSGFYKITTNTLGHVIDATPVDKTDITALGIPGSRSAIIDLGIPGSDTTYQFDPGDGNGQIKVTPSSGVAYNVSVKGLGGAAYQTAYSAGTNISISNGAISCTYSYTLPDVLQKLADRLSFSNGTFYLNGDWYPDNVHASHFYKES